MKIKLFILFSILFLITGCSLDPYENSKYGKDVINAWFSYEKDEIGNKRKEIEDISEIIETECKYKEKYKDYYIFTCTITYSPIGETKIPLSKYKTIDVYALFNPENDTFKYKVYNSSSKHGIWVNDDEL